MESWQMLCSSVFVRISSGCIGLVDALKITTLIARPLRLDVSNASKLRCYNWTSPNSWILRRRGRFRGRSACVAAGASGPCRAGPKFLRNLVLRKIFTGGCSEGSRRACDFFYLRAQMFAGDRLKSAFLVAFFLLFF